MVKISIITVVYNGADLLPATIESVREQTAQDNIEYWIVDGKSKDNTLEIIQSYSAKMPNLRWISEPDKGLYDAMNKALQLATGDFVWFMNGGDLIYGPDTVAHLVSLLEANPNVGVLYGETLLMREDGSPAGTMSELSTRKLPRYLSKRDYLGGMMVVHQSFVPRRALCPTYMPQNLCADYDWCLKIVEQSPLNVHTGQILSKYLMGGLSKKRHQQSLKDRFVVMRTHFGLISAVLAHIWIVFRAFFHKINRRGKERY